MAWHRGGGTAVLRQYAVGAHPCQRGVLLEQVACDFVARVPARCWPPILGQVENNAAAACRRQDTIFVQETRLRVAVAIACNSMRIFMLIVTAPVSKVFKRPSEEATARKMPSGLNAVSGRAFETALGGILYPVQSITDDCSDQLLTAFAEHKFPSGGFRNWCDSAAKASTRYGSGIKTSLHVSGLQFVAARASQTELGGRL